MPRSTRVNLTKLVTNRPAPTSRTTASATSATSKVVRRALAREPRLPERPPSRKAAGQARSRDLPRRQDAEGRPVRSAAPAAAASTRRSMPTSFRRGSDGGSDARMHLDAPQREQRHRAPCRPIERTRLSASSPRASCQRVAPSAARTLTSRAFPVARASIRLATFTQAISSTNATAPSSSNIHARDLPTTDSCIGITPTQRSRNQRGYCALSAAVICSIWASACGP